MSDREPYKAIHFPDVSVFQRSFPVDLRVESIAENVQDMHNALDTGMLLRGSLDHYQTLMPGVATNAELGHMLVAGASDKEKIDFRARQLLAREIAKHGITLATLQMAIDDGRLIDFAVTAINGPNLLADYVEVSGGEAEDGNGLEYTQTRFNVAHEHLSSSSLDMFAVIAFIRSIRESSMAPHPFDLSLNEELLALYTAAPNRMVNRGGKYSFSDDRIDLDVQTTTLTREDAPDATAFEINSQQVVFEDDKSKVTLQLNLRGKNNGRRRPIYRASLDMSSQDSRTPAERESRYERLYGYFLANPQEFYATLGKVAHDFASPY